jgi:hypothetical protein
VKEANSVIQRSANTVDEEKRSYSGLAAVDPRTNLFLQRDSYKRICKSGSLLRIPQQIIISHARPTTREQRPGFSKAVSSNSGSRLLLSCGSTANVRPFFSLLLHTPLTPIFVAGSGKSILWYVISCYCCIHSLRFSPSSGIIEDIMPQREAGSAIVAYFYCDFRDENKQNCRNLVLSIISQLCAQSHLCCDILSRIYLAHDKGVRKPSDETLTKCLTQMVSLPVQAPIYLIVDALDECPNNSGMPTAREEVLELLESLVGLRLPNLHLCVTSRPEIDIQTILEPLTSLCVSLHNQTGQKKDIVDYVNSVVYSDMKMRRWREDDRKLVIETLSERADGM